MIKIILLTSILLLTGCNKTEVQYCKNNDTLKNNTCYKKEYKESTFTYYCNNNEELINNSCYLDNLLTGSAYKKYSCTEGELTTTNKCLVTTTYNALTKKVSKKEKEKYIEKYSKETKEDEIVKEEKPIREINYITYNENKINIYEFYGEGCSHCKNLNNFLNEIQNEYGKYYTLYQFETWNNKENIEIYNEFKNYLNTDYNAVPFLIIGKTIIKGYTKEKESEIINAITSQYQNSYDVYFDARK